MDQPTRQFDKLTRLLKLKRYEVPPPGYFNRFSGQVIARIEALAERQPSWLKRFWLAFEARPSLAASCGVLLGALLFSGFILTQQSEQLPGSPLARNLDVRAFENFEPRAALKPLITPAVLALPQAMSNALAPTFDFGEPSLHVQPLDFTP